MAQATIGDTVRVHYTGTLDDSTVFDSTREGEPLEFTLGESSVIPGLEEAVVGMSPGETTTARVEPARAYGPRLTDLLIPFDRDRLPAHIRPEVGDRLALRRAEGNTVNVVVSLDDDRMVLDANHPLAGQALNFEIELLEIR